MKATWLHYLIMQFIAGEDMGNYLRREGALTPPDAAGILAQAAEGLVWAEARRVVHRDLKPSNLQLDIAGRIHILDFGISKTVDFADGLTRPGESLGTPYYMSPEQSRGEVCDARSDLYSLGVIFFELLTGRRPFDNESVTAIQIAHLSTPAPSLAPENRRRSFRRCATRLCRSCCAKIPANALPGAAGIAERTSPQWGQQWTNPPAAPGGSGTSGRDQPAHYANVAHGDGESGQRPPGDE